MFDLSYLRQSDMKVVILAEIAQNVGQHITPGSVCLAMLPIFP